MKYQKNLTAKNETQLEYIHAIKDNPLVFASGPAGTGKTLIATDFAVKQITKQESIYKRLIVIRPVVATEDLGYLPGTFEEKLDPYLRPIYDAITTRTGDPKKFKCWLDSNILEIAPLAYLRGRTLQDCVVILDEAQNTTVEQMRLFLTRLGDPVKAIITGDPSQSDLPGPNGFVWALKHLRECPVATFVEFERHQVVRSELVRQLLEYIECQNKLIPPQ